MPIRLRARLHRRPDARPAADLSGLGLAVNLEGLDIGLNPAADLRVPASLPGLGVLNADGTTADPWELGALGGLERMSLRGAPRIREGDHMCVDPDEIVRGDRSDRGGSRSGDRRDHRATPQRARRPPGAAAFVPGVPEVVVDDGSMILGVGVVVFAGREL